MDNININCNCQTSAVDTKNEKNIQASDPQQQCVPDRRNNICDRDDVLGSDTSLLFFFLILVCIVCQSDCDISMETLLWFFLLLVVLWNQSFI